MISGTSRSGRPQLGIFQTLVQFVGTVRLRRVRLKRGILNATWLLGLNDAAGGGVMEGK
jgi:hypothetical protein